MYIESSGLRTMIDAIIEHLEDAVGLSEHQYEDSVQIVNIKNARDKAIQNHEWEGAQQYTESLYALARKYIEDYFPPYAKHPLLPYL